MSVLDFLRTKKGSPQTQIGEMEKKLTELRAEIEKANVIVEQHAPKRAHMLLSDATEESIIASDKEADLARLRLERLELAEIALVEQIDAASDASDRQRRAAALDRAANEISAKATALEKATDALAIALGDFLEAIPADVNITKVGHGGHPIPATPAEIASAVVAQGLAMSSSMLFEARKCADGVLRPVGVERGLFVRIVDAHGRLVSFLPGVNGADAEILPTSLAAEQILIAPLRDQARRLLDCDDVREAAE